MDLPERTPLLFHTACVLGGSIAGLLAARVLADHARTVLIIERDQVDLEGRPRAGSPQDRQGHGLLPGGLTRRSSVGCRASHVMLRTWAGSLWGPGQQVVYLDGHQQVHNGEAQILMGSRPFLESRIRSRVLVLPHASTLSAQARNDSVSAVRYVAGGVEDVLSVDFVVDAMGAGEQIVGMGRTGRLRPAAAAAAADRHQLRDRLLRAVRQAGRSGPWRVPWRSSLRNRRWMAWRWAP